MIYRNDETPRSGGMLGELDRNPFQSRPEAVAEHLRNAILAGSLKPGDRLVEQKVAAHFGVGQPTIREALKDLELLGFVRKSSKKHTFVTRLTKEDYRNMLEVRLALEPLAIGRAAQNLTAENAGHLEECVRAMETAAASLDLTAFHRADLSFHRTIWALARNEHLIAALERVSFVLFAFVLVQRMGEDGKEFRGAAKQHQQILAGLRSGDPQAARDAFLQSTTRFWRDYHGIEIGGCDPQDPGLRQEQSGDRPHKRLQGRDLGS
ncbi:MAG: GntR family transcriptional regulator [Acidobacteriota bacterium]